jgi:AraC family transcriptional regulator
MAELMKLDCNGIIFEETLHPEGFWMPKHSHDDAHLVLIFEGGIESFSGRQTSLVLPSDLLFVPAGETHTTQYHNRVRAFYLHFHPSWWNRLRQSMPELEVTHEYRNSLPSWLAMRLYREFQQRDNLTPLMLEGLTLELLVTMSRQENDTRAGKIPRWLLKAQEFLHAHFTESLSVDAVANAVEVHPGHLMRGFRQHFHCTIGDYVRALRIEHACHLLTERKSAQSLAQIALSLGFTDQSHFCKTFKQLTGMTPTELQNMSGRASLKPKMLS